MTTSEIHQRQIILSQIRAEQSLTILDGLDLEIKPATAITIARDEHGVAVCVTRTTARSAVQASATPWPKCCRRLRARRRGARAPDRAW
jgi:hypothetical protein